MMDAGVINPFLNSTINLFEQMYSIEPSNGAPFIVEANKNHRWEISGIIGIVGESRGIVVLRITTILAVKLLEKSGLTIQNQNERPKLINEMIGEFVNIISGNALPELGNKNIELTPPFTVQGKNHSISWPSKTPIIGVPFSTSSGPFEVQISISGSGSI